MEVKFETEYTKDMALFERKIIELTEDNKCPYMIVIGKSVIFNWFKIAFDDNDKYHQNYNTLFGLPYQIDESNDYRLAIKTRF